MKLSSAKLLLGAASLAALFVAAPAYAGDGWSISGSADVTTDYRFRGISNSDDGLAAQVGATLNTPVGIYVGGWASTVNFRDNVFFPGGPETTAELDLYAGYGFDVGDLGLDLSAVYYAYPGSAGVFDYNYWEGILKAKYPVGPVTLTGQVAYSPDFFGVGTDEGWYVAGGASFDVTDWLSASGNYGHQDVGGPASFHYNHWDLGLTATYKELALDVRYFDTDTTCVVSPGEDWCGSTVVATLTWTPADIELE